MHLSNKRNFIPYLIFAAFGVWMILQYSRVFLYFDDFGYLSLSYGYRVPDVAGHSYSLSQLFEFMAKHYSEANGRLLYTGLYLFLYMLGGLRLVQCSMALIVTADILVLYSMTDRRDLSWIQRTILAAFLCLMFGTISLSINRQGTYWFAASFVYLTPCIPFLLLARSYFRTDGAPMTPGKTLLLCLLAFFSGFSQEQWWIATCILTGSIFLYKWLRDKKHGISLKDVLIVLCGFAGGCIIAFSPAVAARLSRDNTNVAFSALSLPEKILQNTKAILGLFTTGDNQPYLTVFLALMFLMVLWMTVKKQGYIKLHIFYLICSAGFFIEPHLIQLHRFSLWIPFLIFTFVEILQFYIGIKMWHHLFIFFAAFGSLACMAVVPELPTRSLLPFLLLSFLLAGDIACCWLKEVPLSLALFSLLLLARPSITNLESTYRGYHENYEILMENDAKLTAAAARPGGENTAETVILEKQRNYDYGGDMMYQEPFGFMEYWIKEYYGLSPETVILYEANK